MIAGAVQHSAGDDAQIIGPRADNVAWVELSAAPELGLAVDGHLTAADQGLGVRSARGDPGKLEQLAKTDHVAGDFDRSLHTQSVSGPIRRRHPERRSVLTFSVSSI